MVTTLIRIIIWLRRREVLSCALSRCLATSKCKHTMGSASNKNLSLIHFLQYVYLYWLDKKTNVLNADKTIKIVTSYQVSSTQARLIKKYNNSHFLVKSFYILWQSYVLIEHNGSKKTTIVNSHISINHLYSIYFNLITQSLWIPNRSAKVS